jgi:uncharacterized membrane protein
MAGSEAGTIAAPRTRSSSRGERASRRNVNDIERVASVAAGGALAAYALRRKDLASVMLGLVGGYLLERGVTGHCHVYDALGVTTAHGDDDPVQQHGPNAVLDASRARRVEHAVTVHGKTPAELYAFWRDFENLPRIMEHLESVEVLDEVRSRWTAKAPAGRTVEWDAEVYNEVPDQLIAWRSLHDADVPNAGSVHFTAVPGGRGTEVRVVLEYDPPAGRLGAAVAKLFREEPDNQVREDLRRFKQLMETGELAVSENPGQGRRVKYSEFNALASNDPKVREARPEPESPHEPRHIPVPADTQRANNTTERGDAHLGDAHSGEAPL